MRQLDSWGDLSLNRFLDKFAEEAKSLPDEIIPMYKELFEETIKLACKLFGDHTFCQWKFEKRLNEFRWNKKPNMVVYDPIMYVLSNMLAHKDVLLNKIGDINQGMQRLFESKQDMFNGRNTSKVYVENRIELFTEFFNGFLV